MKSPSMSDFLTGLENSGWLRHIKAVMDAGVFLAKVICSPAAAVFQNASWCDWGQLQGWEGGSGEKVLFRLA